MNFFVYYREKVIWTLIPAGIYEKKKFVSTSLKKFQI